MLFRSSIGALGARRSFKMLHHSDHTSVRGARGFAKPGHVMPELELLRRLNANALDSILYTQQYRLYILAL